MLGIWLWPKQEEILRAFVGTKKRVAVRSGHKCGKSRIAVIAALWFVCCFPKARVLLTGPTGRQVREVLWNELSDVYRDSKIPIGGRMAKTPAGGFRFEDGRFIIGLSTDAKENIAGYSGPHVLWIVDEASGFDESMFEAIEGNAQSGARIFIISNPTKTAGFFYDAFHRRANEWARFQISSEDAAVYADRIPGLSKPEEVAQRIKSLGRDHPIVRVRILGDFPSAAANSVVALHLVEQGHETWKEVVRSRLIANFGNFVAETDEELTKRATPATLAKCIGIDVGPLEVGVDVARFGDDDTVIQPRRGKFLFPQIIIHGFDSVAVAGAVLACVREHRTPHEKATVKVDGIGYGSGVVDQLSLPEYADLVDVVDVNVSERADDEEKYPNLRSQLWFAVADFLEEGGTLPMAVGEEEGMLDAELMTPTYKFDGQGRQVVEPKAEIKKRMNRSPDRADAVSLAVYRRKRALRPNREQRRSGGVSRLGCARGY